jgi:AcrR family transcriptional regulator
VSPTRSDGPAAGRAAAGGRGSYHHGDLKAALIGTAIDLIAERGVRGFSLAEASRRLGVTVAAPYRHFAGRDDLLAAVAVRAFGVFGAAFAAGVSKDAPPAQQLAAVAGAYVRFAAGHPPLFEVLFGAVIDKARHPELQRAAEPVTEMLLAPARALAGSGAEALITAVAATAHGHAALLLDGMFGPGDEAVATAVARARAAVLAVVAGRAALSGDSLPADSLP